MNLGGIIAKLLGKPKMQSEAPTGWGGWLDTPKGKQWEAIGEKVYDELETAKINAHTRCIVVRDGSKLKKLTINQVARRIADKIGEDAETVRDHVMLWLGEAAEPVDPNDDIEEIASVVERWVEDVRADDHRRLR